MTKTFTTISPYLPLLARFDCATRSGNLRVSIGLVT